MQTPRDISYTGNPTGGTTAYPAVLPAAHEATENPDNIFYRTIRTAMKKQLIYLLASAGLLAASAQTLDATTPRTCHIITYDAKNAGSATLTITLGEDYTDTRTLDCEVNEGAIDDTEKK